MYLCAFQRSRHQVLSAYCPNIYTVGDMFRIRRFFVGATQKNWALGLLKEGVKNEVK